MTAQPSQGQRAQQRLIEGIQAGTSLLLAPPRTVLVVGLGGAALAAGLVRRVIGKAEEEGERQLERINGSLGRVVSRLWPRQPERTEKEPPVESAQAEARAG